MLNSSIVLYRNIYPVIK